VRSRSDTRRAQACLAQAVEEVLSIANISVPLGPDSGQVEIVDRRGFAILTQLEMALLDEPVEFEPGLVEHPNFSITSCKKPV
jgi:hypothetical protein